MINWLLYHLASWCDYAIGGILVAVWFDHLPLWSLLFAIPLSVLGGVLLGIRAARRGVKP